MGVMNNPVVPAQAGTQFPASDALNEKLGPGLRRGDEASRSLEYRAIALLLDYPTELLQCNLDDVVAALSVEASRSLRPLLHRVAETDLLELQSEYLDTFDRGRRTSLNLFEHVHGDSRDRGQAMVDLLATYEAAGLTYQGDQLPDYLPVFLDHLALLPPEQAREQLHEIAHILQTIAAALARRRSIYLPLVALLLARAGETVTGNAEIEDDTSFEAIDAAYKEAQVEFLGALEPASCTTPRAADVQPIHIHRRPSPAVRAADCSPQPFAGRAAGRTNSPAHPLTPLPEGEGKRRETAAPDGAPV